MATPRGPKGPLFAIFLTVFIDMLSFGMAIPDLQLRAESLGAEGARMGILLASYSIAQLFTAPLLGRLSDVRGRRPVLLITCVLTFLCFLLYAHATSLPWIFASRILAGIGAANIGVAFAYIADITTPEERSSGMGLVGAAFGLGFIFGPVIGAELVKAGGGGPQLLGYVAAALAVVNIFFVWRFVPEPDVKRGKAESSIRENFALLARSLRIPGLGLLVALFFVANFAFSNLESTFFRLMHNLHKLDMSESARVLFVVGIVAAFVQGYAIRKLTARYGEVVLMRVGYVLLTPALLSVPFTPPWVPLMLGAAVLGFANGLTGPSVQSLISRSAPSEIQGGIAGVIQSAGALGRIFGPMSGSLLFAVGPAFPYYAAALLMAIPTILSFTYRPQFAEPSGGDGYIPGH